MKEYFEILARCPLFEGVDGAELDAMLGCMGARVIRAEKGEAIFTEGDPADSVGVVLSGMVQIVRDDYYGNRSVIAAVEPGELFGEMFACAMVEALPVSALAMRESRVMLLDCRKVLTVCGNACLFHNRIIRNLLRAVAEKNLVLNRKIQVMSKRTTRAKLMAYLLDQAKRKGSAQFTIVHDRQSLADYLGVERSAMSAEISRLRREGVLDSRGSWFSILRQEEL